MKTGHILGFDIGGTKSSVILATCAGEIVDRASARTEIELGPPATITRMVRDARSLIESHDLGISDIEGVGICCGGPLDSTAGVIQGPANLPGWNSVPVVEIVKRDLGLPAVLLNDADAIAVAEFLFGAGRGRRNVVSFTWGTGIGSGVILNGRLYSGTHGMAGEIGHVTYITGGRPCGCGKRGCIEAYGSGSSIVRLAKEGVESGRTTALSSVTDIDGAAVCDAARAGDEFACEVLDVAAAAMGRAVSISAHTFNPELITLGTMAVHAGDLLMPRLLRTVEEEVWPEVRAGLEIIPTPLGDRIQDLAAVAAWIGTGDRR
jgi:glucokinase